MKIYNYFFYLLVLTMSLSFYSCDNGINLFSVEDDAQLGKELDTEIRATPQEFPIYRGNSSVKSYIDSRIFQEILRSSNIDHKEVFPYQFEIIANDEILNAFALPGGYLYVYTGLLKYLDSEAALAGVLGHEIAHAERRHASQRLTTQYGVSIMLGLLLGENPSQLEEIAANLFVGLSFLANSRSDENEADEYSYLYMKDTRFYAGGVKFFFEKMRDDGLINSESSRIETFLSTHPDPLSRINSTNDRLQTDGIQVRDYTATGEGIYKDEYNLNIRSKL